MKSIGLQVRDFLKAKQWKPADLAKAIGENVRRQHIEQLIANPDRLPHYIRRLAAVMGKSVGELLGEIPQPQEPAAPPEWSYEAKKLARWIDKIKSEPERIAAYAEAILPILRVVNGLPPQPTQEQDAHENAETPHEPPRASPTRARTRKKSGTDPSER